MKILITGATGFIGSSLVKVLLDKDFEIHTIVREHSDTTIVDKRANTFKYDGNIESLIKYFTQEKFDGVIHLASLFLASHTDKDISNLIRSNIQLGTELLEVSKSSKTKWFINTGTFWQNYDNEEYNPVNLYSATKKAFEIIAKYYTETSDLIFTTIKLNDTFGKNDTRNKVFNLWQKIAKSEETLEMSAGEQLIDICYIDDVVSAYEILIEHLNGKDASKFKNKEFAVTSEERMTLQKLSKTFEEATNSKLNIAWGVREYREREVMIPWNHGVLVPGWKPKYSLKEAISKTIGEQ